jgi:hypothetical protein
MVIGSGSESPKTLFGASAAGRIGRFLQPRKSPGNSDLAWNKMRGMTAHRAGHFRREPYLSN